MQYQNQFNFTIRFTRLFFLFSIKLMFVFIVVMSASCSQEKTPATQKTSVQKIDPQKLAGRWQRSDGGYILEIRDIRDNGSIMASYFNPKPINVAEGNWRWHEARLKVFVKFDDVNYTGSTYTLEYLPDKHRLIGTYYQAVLGQEFYVEFSRME